MTPFEAFTGPVTVNTSGVTSNAVTFTVAPNPTVTSVSPRSGQTGSTIQLTGTNLTGVSGTSLAACGTLMVNSTPVTVSPSSSATITTVVPSAALAGPGPMSVTCNGYKTDSVQFTVGTAYDNGNVTLTINGVTESVPYGKSQNATSATVAASMISTINADPNAFVNASANGSTGITLSSRNPGTSSNYAFALTDSYDMYDFSAPSFASTPLSGALAGGTNPTVTQTPVYSYTIPQPNTATTGYDPDGNLLSYTDSVMGTWAFGYDVLNRLTSATTTKAISNGNLNYCWSYDQYGNRLQQSGSNKAFAVGSPTCQPAPTPATVTTNIATYNSSNQMLTSNASGTNLAPSYDASGDITADGTNHYVYDAESRVCAMQSTVSGTMTGYIYNAAGNRVAKGTITTLSCDTTANGFALTSQYLLGPSGEQMTELNATGAWVHTNVTANGPLIATFDNDNKGAHFYLTDWLGTRRVQTNYIGAVENTWTSMPFGDALTSSVAGLDPTEHHFTGKERDTESGLDYFGARYYSSNMGRFMSPDWSAKATPVPYANLQNPQSLNPYSYVRNNPMNLADKDGHCDAPSNLKVGQVGVCVASYISAKKFALVGDGDNRGTNGNGGTSRIQTTFTIDATGKTTKPADGDKAAQSTLLGMKNGLQGTGSSQVSPGASLDTSGNMHVSVDQSGHSAYDLGGTLGDISNHINLTVTPDGKVGVDADSTARQFPALEIYRYTTDGTTVTSTLVHNYEETTPSALRQPEQPLKPQAPQ